MSHPVLAARRLEKRYGGRVAITGVTMTLHAGEVLALLGPNGAGKTTTMRLLAGLLRPTAGQVELDGAPIAAAAWPSARTAIGLLTESPGLWDRLSVQANLLTFARLLGVPNPRSRIARLLDQFGLAERAEDAAGTLSKGMRQKVALARALVHDPRILLLDEPSAGLDPAMTRAFREMIGDLRAEGRAILVSTHNLDEAARIADRVAVLERSLLAIDTPSDLAARWGRPRVRITVRPPADRFIAGLRADGMADPRVEGGEIEGVVQAFDQDVPRLVRALVAQGADVQAVVPVETSLEEAYLAMTRTDGAAPEAGATADAPDNAAAASFQHEPGAPRHPGAWRRVTAIVGKEWQELRRTWAPWLSGLFMLPVLALPFLFTWALPTFAGEALVDSEFAEQLDRMLPHWPALAALSPTAAIQAFLFQQFLVLLVLVPVVGAMSVASHSIVGEKQARSLEPLLATPLTALELLLGKVLAALAPALLLEVGALLLYVWAIALTAEPGVMVVLVSWRSAIVVGVLGPMGALLGLQLVVLSSTRARDPRSAQQIGVLVVIPLVGLLVAQIAGAYWFTTATLLMVGAGLAVAWLGLLVASASRFDVEQVLTRWK